MVGAKRAAGSLELRDARARARVEQVGALRHEPRARGRQLQGRASRADARARSGGGQHLQRQRLEAPQGLGHQLVAKQVAARAERREVVGHLARGARLHIIVGAFLCLWLVVVAVGRGQCGRLRLWVETSQGAPHMQSATTNNQPQ